MDGARKFCQRHAKLNALLMSATAASSTPLVLAAMSQNGLPVRHASDSLCKGATGTPRHEHGGRFSGLPLLRGSPPPTPVERCGVSAHALVDWRIEPAPSTLSACCQSRPKGGSSIASPFGRGLAARHLDPAPSVTATGLRERAPLQTRHSRCEGLKMQGTPVAEGPKCYSPKTRVRWALVADRPKRIGN